MADDKADRYGDAPISKEREELQHMSREDLEMEVRVSRELVRAERRFRELVVARLEHKLAMSEYNIAGSNVERASVRLKLAEASRS